MGIRFLGFTYPITTNNISLCLSIKALCVCQVSAGKTSWVKSYSRSRNPIYYGKYITTRSGYQISGFTYLITTNNISLCLSIKDQFAVFFLAKTAEYFKSYSRSRNPIIFGYFNTQMKMISVLILYCFDCDKRHITLFVYERPIWNTKLFFELIKYATSYVWKTRYIIGFFDGMICMCFVLWSNACVFS